MCARGAPEHVRKWCGVACFKSRRRLSFDHDHCTYGCCSPGLRSCTSATQRRARRFSHHREKWRVDPKTMVGFHGRRHGGDTNKTRSRPTLTHCVLSRALPRSPGISNAFARGSGQGSRLPPGRGRSPSSTGSGILRDGHYVYYYVVGFWVWGGIMLDSVRVARIKPGITSTDSRSKMG